MPAIGKLLVAALLMLSWAVPAYSEEPSATGDPAVAGENEAPKATTKEWIRKGSEKVVEIDFDAEAADIIYGKVQKPGVDYLITQGELKYEGMPLERNLLKELEASVSAPYF